MCDLIFSGVFERHPRLTLAIVRVRAGVGCQTGAFSRRTRAKRLGVLSRLRGPFHASLPKTKFAADSALEEAVRSELVSEMGF